MFCSAQRTLGSTTSELIRVKEHKFPDKPKKRDLIQQLGDDSFDKREDAGKKAIACGSLGCFVLDIESGKELLSFGESKQNAFALGLSPDGLDKTIRLWDVATGKELRRMTGQTPQHFEYAVFTPDGKRIVSGGTGGDGSNYALRSWTVRVWDLAAGKLHWPNAKTLRLPS